LRSSILSCGFALALLAGGLLAAMPALSQDSGESLPTIAEKTEGMEAMDGFVPLYWDNSTGKIWMEVSRFGKPFLLLQGRVIGKKACLGRLRRGEEHEDVFSHTVGILLSG